MDSENLKKYINTENALARLMGNKNLYKKLLRSFLDNRYAENLCGEIERGELETAIKSAHTVKGLCANLALSELYDRSVELEACLKGGSDVEESCARFKTTLNETVDAAGIVLENN